MDEDPSSSGPGRVPTSYFGTVISLSGHKDPLNCFDCHFHQRLDSGNDQALKLWIPCAHESRAQDLKSRYCGYTHRVGLRTSSASYFLSLACHSRRNAGLKRYSRGHPLRLSLQKGDVLIPLHLSYLSYAIALTLSFREIRIVIQRRSPLGKYHCSRSSGHPFRKAPWFEVQLESNHPWMSVSWYALPTKSRRASSSI